MNKFTKYRLVLGITASALIVSGGAIQLQMNYNSSLNKADREKFGEYINDFNTTNTGKPIRLNTDKPITISIDSENSQVRQNIIDGINNLSSICPNIQYEIYNNDTTALSNINFRIEKLSSTLAGHVQYSYNSYSAEITFPITISVDEKYIDAIWPNSNNSVMTTIVEHELMHTLGFNDSTETNSIMYKSLNENLQTYTSFDKTRINYVYGDRTIAYSVRPKICYFIPNNKMENEEELVN